MVRNSYARQAIHVQFQVIFDRNQTVFCFVLFSNVELFIMDTLANTVVPDEIFAIHGQIYSVMRGSRGGQGCPEKSQKYRLS